MSIQLSDLLSSLAGDEGRLVVVDVGELTAPICDVISGFSARAENWRIRYATHGLQLETKLEESGEGSYVLAFAPSDMDLRFDELAATAKTKKMKIILVVGESQRSKEDRCRSYYLQSRGGRR